MKPNHTIRRRGSQRGMTLIEVLVAILVFTVVFLAALGLYQAANRAYLATDAATIQQQNARYAIDRMSETLRDAGANYNGMGRSNLADEQVEGAWESAVLVRGDFNNRRENGIAPSTVNRESTAIPMVTTDNTEIVGYVLRKPEPVSGPSPNSISLPVRLDVTPTARDAVKSGNTITGEEARTIMVAASNLAEQTSPPYQLVRVSFNDAGSVVYQVIADNVFRLSFVYKDAAGTENITSANDGGDDGDRAARAAVRRIGMNLVMMGARADFNYNDPNNWTTDIFGHTAPAQGASTRNRRKFNLSEEIVAVNLGKRGYRHNSAPNVNIAAPAFIKVCTGHCKSFNIQWAATTTPGIATYKLRIQASSPFVDAYIAVPTTSYTFTQSDPTIQAYQFSVAGMTTTGLVGPYSPVVTKTATHEVESIPSSPTNVAGAQGSGNVMSVTWNQVTTNTGTITASTCTQAGTSPGVSAPPSPWNNQAVDLAYHQVHRGLFAAGYASGVLNGNFTSASGNRVDLQEIGDLKNTTPRATNVFTDNTAAPCGQYFYRVRAFDGCDIVEAGNGSAAMSSAATFIPAGGVTPAIPQPPTPAAAVLPDAFGNYVPTFTWPEVTRDSNGRPARVAHYQLVRERQLQGETTWTALTPNIRVWETNTASDSVPATVSGLAATYRYAVKAVYQCGAVGDSDRERQGDWYTITCQPPTGNSITSVIPGNGTEVNRPSETGFTPRMNVTGTAWTGAELTIRRPDGTVFATQTGTAVGSPITHYTFPTFNAEAVEAGNWTFTFIGAAGSCRSTPQTSTVRIQNAACGVSLASAAWVSTNGGSAYQELDFRLKNDCDFASLTVNGLSVAWTGVTASSRYVTQIDYNSTPYRAGLNATSGAEGTMIPFTSPNAVTLTGGATSGTFRINFNDNMTLSGAHNNNDPGSFESLLMHISSPTPETDDEAIATSPLSPPFTAP